MGQAGTLSYPRLDHLTVAVTDSAGGVAGTAKHWPYGSMRAATGVLATVPPGTDKLNTGQQMESGDAALGLYNYKARFYSTTLGRFVDTFARASRGADASHAMRMGRRVSCAWNRSRGAPAIRYHE